MPAVSRMIKTIQFIGVQIALLALLGPANLLAEDDLVIIEILGGVGTGSGPAVDRIESTDHTYFLLEDYLNTSDEEIRKIQLFQNLRGFDPEIKTSSQRFSFMVQGSPFFEMGTSLQMSNFKATNLYPRYLKPLFPSPIPFYSPSWNEGPFRQLARTDYNSALYLYNLRQEEYLEPSFFLSLDLRVVLPLGPAAIYLTGSLPLGENSGNGRSAFALGFRMRVLPGLALYAEGHRSYSSVVWADQYGRNFTDIAYDTGVRFGIGIGGAN
ncbi:MAG TPA: hypothetical protein DEA96_16195 [Leptospiraceae bacterium]|nr:hypothetical protein [Spirochaetaceae bacterium]HBS06511.1 hypothetical protein [Leptospiraceae bacterium]|tara:strand:- start:15081 stop:15884 length:804 start_codon:yes stop_codon:yes gene_type:complete